MTVSREGPYGQPYKQMVGHAASQSAVACTYSEVDHGHYNKSLNKSD